MGVTHEEKTKMKPRHIANEVIDTLFSVLLNDEFSVEARASYGSC